MRSARPLPTVLRLLTTLVLLAATLAGCRPAAGPAAPAAGVTRRYFVQAEQVLWDYAPTGRNEVTGRPFTPAEQVFVARGPGRVGSTYLKCVYRGYTDGTFRTPVPRPAEDAYLGLLGPTLRAAVGDTLEVRFRNTCSFPASMHPHGVRYAKASEGASYADGSDPRRRGEGAVPPGSAVTYTWEVPERSGPGPMEGSSVGWMYHSHADEVADVYAGLTGFLVVTARGKARADASPVDVDGEVFSLYEVDDENQSSLASQNLARRGPGPDLPAEELAESNLMHAVNGYVYGNGPVVQLRAGQRVRWYLMGMGTEVDLHTPHWHGSTVTVNGMRTDVASLLPGGMVTADMVPDAAGTWLYHCHVGDHITAGMVAKYQVLPA